MQSKLWRWFLKTFTGHYYDQVNINGRVYHFSRTLIVHGDSLTIKFLNAQAKFENHWGTMKITTIDRN